MMFHLFIAKEVSWAPAPIFVNGKTVHVIKHSYFILSMFNLCSSNCGVTINISTHFMYAMFVRLKGMQGNLVWLTLLYRVIFYFDIELLFYGTCTFRIYCQKSNNDPWFKELHANKYLMQITMKLVWHLLLVAAVVTQERSPLVLHFVSIPCKLAVWPSCFLASNSCNCKLILLNDRQTFCLLNVY